LVAGPLNSRTRMQSNTTSKLPMPPTLASRVEQTLAAAREQNPESWARILANDAVAASLPLVWACSQFVVTSCTRRPDLLEQLVANGRLFERAPDEWIAQDLACALAGVVDADLPDTLRRLRRRHLVRIAWRDLAGLADLDETLRDLSTLADACIAFAYDHSYKALVARYGTPHGSEDGTAQPMMILAMGKLGGGELNYSSDIDLVLLYPQEGSTDGARSVDNAEFFLRLGQKVAQLLAAPTVEGFVYRVDLRLRPFGDSGRIAVSFDAFEDYLQQHGRDWERYAYIKARAVTAVTEHAALYESVLRPFVYRRYLDFGVFESLREMKSMIEREVERRELRDNIKLGPGGIREIEFIVQAFQLLRGGSDRRLQSRQLRTVLPLLVGERLLKREAVRDLDLAYRYLRKLENRLQEWNDEQTHELPQEADARARLALAMGVADWERVLEQLNAHRQKVARHFAQTVFGPTHEPSEGTVTTLAAFDIDASPAERARLLGELGFREPVPIAELLEQLSTSAYYRHLDETGRRRLRDLLPRMLPAIASSAAPPVCLTRIIKILEKIGGRTVYLALLNENGVALRRLIELCTQSQFLADQIASHPLLLDELIDARMLEELPTREQFAVDLTARLVATHGDDPERQVEALLHFQRAAFFRVAVLDLTGKLTLMKVSDRLSDIAELIVGEVLALAWAHVVARHGTPHYVKDGIEHAATMVVIAYGKLGGLELGYGSDLDLVFLHDSTGEGRTDAAQPIDNSVFFQRLGQRLVHLLTVHSAAGRLYEVDTRLRPGGNRGLLVQSLAGFRDYEFEDAWTWEHQSLLRARAIVGVPALRAHFEDARVEVLRKAVRRDNLKSEVRKMRERMRENLSRAGAGQFDLKQDAGGVADLEFLVQFWMLRWADKYPQIVIFSDNIRQLESLASGNLVPQSRVDFLVDTYRKYRARLHRLSLDGSKNLIGVDEFVAERRGVVEIWDEVMREA
jgi:glutamate-ammonia-ligase adenylyltransferase